MLVIAPRRREHLGYYLDQQASTAPSGVVYREPDGRFIGSLANTLGLDDVTPSATSLSALLNGVDPCSGEILDERHHRVTNVAYDCVFAAPKSVSVLFALSPSEVSAEVERAHDASVDQALSYLESHSAQVRRTHLRDVELIDTKAVAAAAFVHRVSRALDPHLHSHVLVASLGADREGVYSALDARALFENLAATGALYRAHLRYELSHRLGVQWQSRDSGFGDLVGLPSRAIRGFSQRSSTIAAELGDDPDRSSRLAALSTRQDKVTSISFEELREAWRERGYSLGLARSVIDEVVDRGRAAPLEAVPIGEVAGEVARARDVPFGANELVKHTANVSWAGAKASDVLDGVSEAMAKCNAESLRVGSMRTRAGTRIPSAMPRFLSLDARERQSLVASALADAVVFGAGGQTISGEMTFGPSSTSLQCLTELSLIAQPNWRAIARDDRRADYLTTMTGITTDAASRSSHAVAVPVVVVDVGIAASTLLSIRDQAANGGSAVLYVDFDRRNDLDTSLPMSIAGATASETVENSSVAFCRSPHDVIASAVESYERARVRGESVAICSGSAELNRTLNHFLGAASPTRVRPDRVIVIGGSGAIGHAELRSTAPREHFVVAAHPLSVEERRLRAREVIHEKGRGVRQLAAPQRDLAREFASR